MNTRFAELDHRFEELNLRFDHFLGFVGKDVQDLRFRVTAVEQQLKTPKL